MYMSRNKMKKRKSNNFPDWRQKGGKNFHSFVQRNFFALFQFSFTFSSSGSSRPKNYLLKQLNVKKWGGILSQTRHNDASVFFLLPSSSSSSSSRLDKNSVSFLFCTHTHTFICVMFESSVYICIVIVIAIHIHVCWR